MASRVNKSNGNESNRFSPSALAKCGYGSGLVSVYRALEEAKEQSKVKKDKKVAKEVAKGVAVANKTPEEIAYEMPSGIAYEVFHKNATRIDRKMANRMYKAFCFALEELRPEGATSYQFVMAATRLAQTAIQWHATPSTHVKDAA